ncbi:hypothetical protein MTX26_36245 (plasmid) [Bradyrhizobium sp. ISRA443]|uniref:hypothetical protein n=1 Tax=unclassified Bradyrhizobium TaxID=2631580 RepID=UPI00247ACB1B|nr:MULTISPECIES: hypothetical protein [unclassified Bradyrhizobium]WGS03004.1 hypothetical protein MTX23_35800 [Bradyrhizobium sp. ISRA436]WGS09959.1 hypothetical protein MTX18_36240 [Bradyrhizobium sp. ISRA437]WGS16844.1 hypothetical protein MTX26_36245 [Bradyrhizobium sp. ISRA443]
MGVSAGGVKTKPWSIDYRRRDTAIVKFVQKLKAGNDGLREVASLKVTNDNLRGSIAADHRAIE